MDLKFLQLIIIIDFLSCHKGKGLLPAQQPLFYSPKGYLKIPMGPFFH